MRLQCYEGLDEAKALYEWNYRKQLLRIQTEADDAGWQAVQDDIFGEEFLLARPLLRAIASEEPVVLLIDEIDKTDQEFEAMLLEVLSDFQISIPELGRVDARTQPVVLLTSNNSRELTEALKRRCLYLWLDYPEAEHELAIVRLHAPDLSDTVAARLVEIVGMVRELDLKKPPSIAESIDWARALLLLGADEIDGEVFRETMSVIVKHRTDMEVVAERVGLKLGAARRCRLTRPARAACRRRSSSSASELRDEGVKVGTSELLDAFAAIGEIDWRSQPRFREALAATLAKSQEDRRVFELVFDRFFFRAVELARPRTRSQRNVRRGRRDRWRRRALRARKWSSCGPDCRRPLRRRRGRDARPRAPGDRGFRAPPGGLGRDRRRRAADPPGTRAAHRTSA